VKSLSRSLREATRSDGGGWHGPVGAHHPDPFAVNPIRRSLGVVAFSAVIFFGPLLIGGAAAETALLAGGWLGMMGLAFGVPVLVLSVAEEGWRQARVRLDPPIDRLDLSPRLVHVLRRHGYESIAQVERTPDAVLLLLSNMDRRGLSEVRRAISLHRYRQWQERGFP
jgi:hypothetical protein